MTNAQLIMFIASLSDSSEGGDAHFIPIPPLPQGARITEEGDVRVTEEGDIRVIE